MACGPFAGLVRSGVLGAHLLLATDGRFHWKWALWFCQVPSHTLEAVASGLAGWGGQSWEYVRGFVLAQLLGLPILLRPLNLLGVLASFPPTSRHLAVSRTPCL